MTVTVISTGRNAPTKDLCLSSVKQQIGAPYNHIYVESPANIMPLEHWHREIHKLPPDEIVVLLDGDDWLFSAASLIDVQRLYLHNPECMLTYGQFVDLQGRVGFASKYTTTDYRSAPWLATHLKTFRAGLFQKIQQDDLMYEGEGPGEIDPELDSTCTHKRWIPMASDCAAMIPMLEMAGPHRIQFWHQPLCVYNIANSYWANNDAEGRKVEEAWAQIVRMKPRYGRLP
jgi:hypothetical protein